MNIYTQVENVMHLTVCSRHALCFHVGVESLRPHLKSDIQNQHYFNFSPFLGQISDINYVNLYRWSDVLDAVAAKDAL